ncbi:MAG: rhodanese-like domain-containing protein [Candidatus Roizmanbacteria bacterium]|nr:rhodanese-like domain-containing protein [Candidatus Roizmanbacteria bacterium]
MSKQVSVEDVHSTLGSPTIALIDVRTPGEFARGPIQGSINIPVDEIREKIEDAVPDKEKTIYLYCLSGSRSETAANILTGLGYTNAFSMTNGLLMWRSKRY